VPALAEVLDAEAEGEEAAEEEAIQKDTASEK
jgi:hypothetical protein